ncbi:MAG TPA: hypothetical protein VM536_20050 [Chloroflexia bacterium]|nr:hypothetical protein [Chloroflexia bacterium]
MVLPESRRPRRGRLLVALLLSLLPAFIAAPTGAFAGTSGCRTDPIILLSNGALLDMSATIGTSLFDVQEVTYTLHAPRGTRLVAVVRTPNWPTTIEHFNFVADADAGEYNTDTIVVTGRRNVDVTATTTLGLRGQSASGHDREHLQVHFTR